MKNVFSIFFPILMVTAAGCSDSGSSAVNDVPDNGTHWNLVNVSGSIAGVSNDFEAGLITWTFDDDAHTVTVVNNNTDEMKEDFFATGTYNFSYAVNEYTPEECSHTFVINETDLGCMQVQGDTLTFSQQAADGYGLILVK